MIPISNAYVVAHIRGEATPLGGHYFFAYAKSWLAREGAYPIDPLHLQLSSETFTAERIFDVLLDAGPDNWGKRVVAATHTQLPSNRLRS